MKRVDRILSEQTNYSRKEIKKLISKGLVSVNGKIIDKYDEKYDEKTIKVNINSEEVKIEEHLYLLLNKPKGYVSTTSSYEDKTVLDFVPSAYQSRNLFPAGRLDKDTTGLMLITDDGIFSHNILSPKKHIKKVYEVTINIPINNSMIDGFSKGVKLNDGRCKTALLEKKTEFSCLVTLTEGRYHQIKRMFGCFGAKVVALNRICMGNLYLPDDLKVGKIRKATKEELLKIQNRE